MAHQHAHHGPPASTPQSAFAIGVALNTGFVVVEAAYGLFAGSLALLADAGHNLGDVLGLLLAWGASRLAAKPPTWTHTYGYRRATLMASLISACLLFVAVGGIAFEALERLSEPKPLNGFAVLVVAAIGVIINTATALMFMAGQKHDLNVKGAFLHMAADAAVSLGVVIAGLGMMASGWLWLDPLVSLAIVVVILASTWGLFRESFQLIMDRVPQGIDLGEVAAFLRSLEGVNEVHDLHVWAVSTTENVLTAHLVAPQGASDAFLKRVARAVEERFGIHHTTLQVETGDAECDQACASTL